MYIIESYTDIVGKEIGFIYFVGGVYVGDKAAIIGTRCGGVFIAKYEENVFDDIYDVEVRFSPLSEPLVLQVLDHDETLSRNLHRAKVLTDEEYESFKNRGEKRRQLELERINKAREEKDRKEYERLKAKFEGDKT